MKFIKKSAALFFCLTLAFCVMAVTASATSHTFSIKLELDTAVTDFVYGNNVNGDADGYKEVLAGADKPITYKVFLRATNLNNGEASPVVDAISFKVAYNTGITDSATLNSTADNLKPTLTLASNVGANLEGNNGEVSWSDSFTECAIVLHNYKADSNTLPNGFDITSSYQQIGTLVFHLSGTASQKASFAISNVAVKETTSNERADASVDNGGDKLEVDPEYIITVKNPAVADVTLIKTGNYTETVAQYKYTILTGLTEHYNVQATPTPDSGFTVFTATETKIVGNPSLNYYDFQSSYVAVAPTGTEHNWTAASYTSDNLDSTKTGDTGYVLAKAGSYLYGNVTLNPVYLPTEYTITIERPNVDGYGIIPLADGQAYTTSTPNPNEVTAESTSYKYTIEGKNGKNSTTDATIGSPTDIDAYTFTQYAIKSGADTTWNDGTITLSNNSWTVPQGRHGNVTLVAQYTPITYTMTYVLGDNAEMTGTSTWDATNKKGKTYTINNTAATAPAFSFVTTPTRAGYKFTGWTAEKSGNGTNDVLGKGGESATEWPTTAPNTDAVAARGKYGNVTLTANWAIIGDVTVKSYQYAYKNAEGTDEDLLILFAVAEPANKGDNATEGAYVYKVDTKLNPMFEVKKDYKDLFTGDDLQDNAATNYTIYGYLATVTGENDAAKIATARGNIEFVAKATDSNMPTVNQDIKYQGDMTLNDTVDAGDFGNVVAILANRAQYGRTTLSVQKRLEADVSTPAYSADPQSTWQTETGKNLGTIDDVKAIMNIFLKKTS